MPFACGRSFSEDRPLGWDPVAAGNRASDGMARTVSEEEASAASASTCLFQLHLRAPFEGSGGQLGKIHRIHRGVCQHIALGQLIG